MVAIVGLGNLGEEYAGTRHNTGFLALDRLAADMGVQFKEEKKFLSLIARPDNKEIVLVKPQTFMNRSGESVASFTAFYKIPPQNIWVIYDDVDLPVGTARARNRGLGRTKHKGLLSIAAALGTHEFPRFRIGIAHAGVNVQTAERPHEPVNLKDFVLQPFDKRELPLVEKAMSWVVAEVIAALKRGSVISKTLTKGVT